MEIKISIITAYIFSFIYGYLNAIGFIVMNGLFFTFMSGNSIRLGVNLGKHNLNSNLKLFSIFISLLGGIFIGDMIFSFFRKKAVGILFFLEFFGFLLALVFSLKYSSWVVFLPLGIAMGIQNIINLLLGNNFIGKSFITGLIFNLGTNLSRIMQGKGNWKVIQVYLFTWFSFIAGAVAGTLMIREFNLSASILFITVIFAHTGLYIKILLKNKKELVKRNKRKKQYQI